MTTWLCVLVQTPAHAALGPVLTYRSPQALPAGTLVRVPLGRRETLGVVWEAAAADASGEIDPDKVRDIAGTLEGIAPLLAELGTQLRPIREFLDLRVPQEKAAVIARIHAVGQVVTSRYTGKNARFKVRIPPHLHAEFAPFLAE